VFLKYFILVILDYHAAVMHVCSVCVTDVLVYPYVLCGSCSEEVARRETTRKLEYTVQQDAAV
jgi:hypothetical protein